MRAADGAPWTEDEVSLSGTVLVPIGRPRSASNLTRLAAGVCASDDGAVAPLMVIPPDAADETRLGAHDTVRLAEEDARTAGLEASGAVCVSADVADRVLRGVLEHDAALVVVGWPSGGQRDGTLQGPVADIVAKTPAPLLVARLAAPYWDRVVLSCPSGPVSEGELASFRLAVAVAGRLSLHFGLPAVVRGASVDPRVEGLLRSFRGEQESGDRATTAEELAVSAIEPDPGELALAVARTEDVGDVILVLSHGPAAPGGLLAASDRLYREDRHEGSRRVASPQGREAGGALRPSPGDVPR